MKNALKWRSFWCSIFGETGGVGLSVLKILEEFHICKNQCGRKAKVIKLSNVYSFRYWQKENNIELKLKKKNS